MTQLVGLLLEHVHDVHLITRIKKGVQISTFSKLQDHISYLIALLYLLARHFVCVIASTEEADHQFVDREIAPRVVQSPGGVVEMGGERLELIKSRVLFCPGV